MIIHKALFAFSDFVIGFLELLRLPRYLTNLHRSTTSAEAGASTVEGAEEASAAAEGEEEGGVEEAAAAVEEETAGRRSTNK